MLIASCAQHMGQMLRHVPVMKVVPELERLRCKAQIMDQEN